MINNTNRYSTSTDATLRLTFHCLLTSLATTPCLAFIFLNCISLRFSGHIPQYVARTEILGHAFRFREKASRSQRGSQCFESCTGRRTREKVQETK